MNHSFLSHPYVAIPSPPRRVGRAIQLVPEPRADAEKNESAVVARPMAIVADRLALNPIRTQVKPAL